MIDDILYIKPLYLEDILDRLITGNYLRIRRNEVKHLSSETYLSLIRKGYSLVDLAGLFPDNQEYSEYIYFLPHKIYCNTGGSI